MFGTIMSIETSKYMRRTILWIELSLIALLVVIMNIVIYSMVRFNLGDAAVMQAETQAMFKEMLVWPGSLLNALQLASSGALGGLLVVVLVGAVTAQEYTWRTFHLMLSRGTSRTALLWGKLASLAFPLLLIVVTPLVVGGLITAIFSLELNGSLQLDLLNPVQLVWSILRTMYSLLPYATLTFLLAILTRSMAAAIGGGLAYTLLVESLLVQLLGLLGGNLAKLGQYLPAGFGASLNRLNQSMIQIPQAMQNNAQSAGLDPVLAAAGIGLWTLLLAGLAIWRFRNQDLAE